MEFSEEQKFRNTLMYIMLGASLLVMLGGLGFAILHSIQESNTVAPELYYAISISVFAFGLAMYIIFRITLYTSVDSGGFHYRYPPLISRKRTVYFEQMVHWRVRPLKSIGEFGGYGHRRMLFTKKTAIVMGSGDAIELELEKGRKLIFSTAKPEALKESMRKYAAGKEIV
ncbi:MAG: hypothetical protein R2794_01430 [Chitinophagales bacterium]